MKSINKVILIGNVCNTPHYRKTVTDKGILMFNIATNREWTSMAGKQTSTEFHSLIAFDKSADFLSQHLQKGKYVYAEGYLKTRTKENSCPEHPKTYKTEIVIENIIFLDKNPNKNIKDDIPENYSGISHELRENFFDNFDQETVQS